MDAFVQRKKRKCDGNISPENKRQKPREHSDVDQEQGLDCQPTNLNVDDTCSDAIQNKWTSDKVLQWKQIRAENLDCDYTVLLPKPKADVLLQMCEKNLTYNSGRLAQVQIFGKWLDIPRKQVSRGKM